MNELFQIYHCRENLESTQTLNCHIEDEALLCVMPDPVVCYRDAIFSQKQVGQHALIQEFFSGGGGGGGVQARWPENSLDNLFLLDLNLFYSLQRGYNGFITEKSIHCQGSRGGPTFSRGVQLFPGWGVQMQISIETHITCDFPGGGGGGGAGPRILPSGSQVHRSR